MMQLYREGFLDGLRYAGHLLEDVENEDLVLNAECEKAILDGYKRGSATFHGEKMHRFVKRLVLDCNEQYDRIEELEAKLANYETRR